MKMSSSNYLLNVPKLKGRENYTEWTFAAENFLVLEEMRHCIEPVAGIAVTAADDAKTKAKLIMTIDSSLYVHIKNVTTTRQLWQKLKELFDDSGFSRRISLLRHLISIRLESCSSMTSYVTEIIETGQKLSGTGFNIDDCWIGCLLLAGLSEKYSPMIMAIEHSGIPITSDAIKVKLLDMETDTGNHEVNGAFASSYLQKGQHHKNKKSMQSMATNQDGASKKTNVRCYKCKQPGHYKNQCTNNENNQSNFTKNARKQTNAFSAVFLSGDFNKSEWYIDSGASSHLTAMESWIMNKRSIQEKEIIVANSNKLKVSCIGDVKIVTKTDACEFDVPVKDVLCVPELTTNLLSVSQLIKNNNQVSFSENGCSVYNKDGQLVAQAVLTNGVYKLMMPENVLAACGAVSSELWHRRLGHVNSQYLNQMTSAVEGIKLSEKSDTSKSSCPVCCQGKQSRLPFTNVGTRSTEKLALVHTDICGPMEVMSMGGSKYFLLFVDDYTRYIFVYFLQNKNQALKCFKNFKALVENQLNKKIKTLRSDNGLEFCNREFDTYLQNEGINHQKTNPYTPEQNGLCERTNRTVVEKARCLLFDSGLGKEFWGEATNTAVYLQNRTVASGLSGKTPFEMWTGTKPDLSHLRVFGSNVMVHIPKEKRKKWDKKSEIHILVGYPDNVKGYRIYNPRNKTVTTSRDVIIMEHKQNTDVTIPVQESFQRQSDTEEDIEEISSTDTSSSQLSDADTTFVPSEYEECEDETSLKNRSPKPVRERKKTDRYGYSNMCITEEIPDDASGLSLDEALNGPEKEQWLKAVNEEIQCFEDNNAWELVDIPVSGTVVKCKWVLKKKFDSDSNVRYRARLVAKGFMQKKGVDYDETFSPVVRHATLRLLFALAIKLNLDITHLDVTTAFLNGDLEETIFMQKPEGFPDSQANGKVLKLKKAIYGLKQSSRAWYKKVDDCLLGIGYKRSKVESCLYTKINNGCITIVTLYVDDFFVFSNDVLETVNLKQVLSSKFKLKDMGIVKQCLGMSVNVDKDKGVITLSQENYINQLLVKFNMTESKTFDTPMEDKLHITKEENCNLKVPYQQLIGSLMYLAVLTRPDIMYSVSFLSQFNNSFNNKHWMYAKRVLKYLNKTKSFGLTYTREGNSELVGYVDADWGNNIVDRRSYSGVCFVLCGGAISWSSRKQKSVALSSTEAEYMAITEACTEAIYLRNILLEISDNVCSIQIFNDNQGALKLSSNDVFHNRTKHIDVRYHFCRDCVNDKIVNLQYLETAKMPADLLTKSLGCAKHYMFMEMLGVKECNLTL